LPQIIGDGEEADWGVLDNILWRFLSVKNSRKDAETFSLKGDNKKLLLLLRLSNFACIFVLQQKNI
jgi:hypothetical protein